MGKSAHTVNSTDVVSTVLSTLTILSSIVIPPTIHINSILDTLMKDVGEILGLTRSSKHQELEEFGEYVDKMINRLVLGFQNERLAQRTNVIKNLNELQRTLWMILRCISHIRGSEGVVSRIGHVLHPEEDQIPRMRQRLDDALKLFEFGAFIEMLMERANPPTSAAASRPVPGQTHGPSNSTAHNHTDVEGHQAPQTAGQLRSRRVRPFPLQLASSHSATVTVTQSSSLGDGELVAAGEKVKRLRHSLRNSHSAAHMIELATALGLLSNLLAKAGRTSEALETSQESVEIYRTLAEKGV